VGTGTIVVTGANGFVGKRLCDHLDSCGIEVRRLARGGAVVSDGGTIASTAYGDADCLERTMAGADAVVHLAARAHVVHESAVDALAEYRRVNVALSLRLADAAMSASVRRFVFVSSIGAVGASSAPGAPLHESSRCSPTSLYGRSKLEAEMGLARRLAGSATELVVLRPSLVHGPGAPGNLARLRRLIDSGMPLPLSSIRNQRSLIHVDNLSRLLHLCVNHPLAAGRIFHARDAHDRSTPELFLEAAQSRGRRARLFPFPVNGLTRIGRILGLGDQMKQLVGWLQVDDRLTRKVLDFTPEERMIEL
jgi:nucleoside-diphosphate-sugar epimerase